MAELLPQAMGWLDSGKRALYRNIVDALNDPGGTLKAFAGGPPRPANQTPAQMIDEHPAPLAEILASMMGARVAKPLASMAQSALRPAETITLKGIPEAAPAGDLPPVAEGFKRLFRGGDVGKFSEEVGREQQGRWFTSEPKDASMYGSRNYVDVPQAIADATHKGGGAHVLPTEWAAKAVPELGPLPTPAIPPAPDIPL